PDEEKEHCTSVLVGEGEELWLELLADLKRGALQPFYRQSPLGGFDLAQAPMPRFELLEPDRYNRLTVQTARGCPHRCEFCASSRIISPSYKVKPVAKVLAELDAIQRIWARPFIEFADDNSFAKLAHARELVHGLLGQRIRWFAETDVSIGQDADLLGMMRDSGCKMVLIGLESPSAASLEGIELNANWKRRQLEGYAAAIERIQSYGIRVIGCFVLGLDGDTPDTFRTVFDFARELGLYDIQITFLTPFPGTPLYERLKDEGRILREDAWELCTLFDINHRPKGMTVEELQAGFLWLAEAIYSEEETQARQAKFKRSVRESPHFGRRTLEG
ncbi:MAG: radical SAM protein, partial [Candidatus Bipolaricaulota bacterium]